MTIFIEQNADDANKCNIRIKVDRVGMWDGNEIHLYSLWCPVHKLFPYVPNCHEEGKKNSQF